MLCGYAAYVKSHVFLESSLQFVSLLLKLAPLNEVIVKGKSFDALVYEGVVSVEVSGARSVYFI